LGLATTALFKFFPSVLQENLGAIVDIEGKYLIVIVLLISAVFSLPASKVIDKYGVQRVFYYSLGAIIVSIAGIMLFNAIVLTVFFGLLFAISFTTLSVSSLPLAINKANYYEKVFCVGIFFSGVEVFDSVVDIIQAY
jgi:MFS family permease